MKIGEVLKLLLNHRKMSQFILAEKSGLGVTYVNQILNNHRNPTESDLDLISNIIKYPIPFIHFMCLEIERDIPKQKHDLFRCIRPSITKMLIDVFEVTQEDLNLFPIMTESQTKTEGRQPGFYWVKVDEDSDWTILKYHNHSFLYNNEYLTDEYFYSIDEYQIKQ